MHDPLLAVSITVNYPQKPSVLRDAAFTMEQGEILGLIGQSGSGKSTIALSLLGLLQRGCLHGSIRFEGREICSLPERQMRHLRGRRMALVPQSPLTSLNPALTIGAHLHEVWRAHENTSITQRQCLDALETVSLPGESAFLKKYPSEISVGQAQRVLIAMAVLHRPALIVADEPTSALDAITQAEILKLFARLNREMGMGILLISHELRSVASLCHRVAILHEGHIVECGDTREVFVNPRHAYSRKLIEIAYSAALQPDKRSGQSHSAVA